jgi:ABC-2 type transport system ATP-binding protein/lipopolysaccharide transport system ATP-binding protein
VSVTAGTGYMDFEVAELTLQPSTFRVTAAAVDRGHTYDYRDRAFELRVRAQGAITEPGIVRMLGSWRHTPTSTAPVGRSSEESP